MIKHPKLIQELVGQKVKYISFSQSHAAAVTKTGKVYIYIINILIFYCYFIVILLLLFYYYFIIILLLFFYCYYFIVIILLLLFYCYYFIVIILLLLFYCYYFIDIISCGGTKSEIYIIFSVSCSCCY